MEILESLSKIPERETGGSTAIDRFDFQTCWGVAHLLRLHESKSDYAIAFEFHDDIVVVDSVNSPTTIQFFQLKTKKSGKWTIKSLAGREKSEDGTGLKSSIIGKMLDNKSKFGASVSELGFVSNQPCNFIDQINYPCALSTASGADRQKLIEAIKIETPSFSDEILRSITYQVSDFMLSTYEETLLGKIVNFIERNCELHECSHKGFFLSLIDQCRVRSKRLADTSNLQNLLETKFVTRNDMTGWLEALVRRTERRPKWAEVTLMLKDEKLSVIRKLKNGWDRYEIDIVTKSDVAFIRTQEIIRSAVSSPEAEACESLSLLIGCCLPKISLSMAALQMPMDETYISAGILYEVWIDE